MKTRDRILLTSLELFNTEGEPNVTTVDIANEMDISPGNLYYHFKGKEEIIGDLYAQQDAELSDILNAPLQKVLSTEDVWFYLYVVFEQIFNHRYFYRNLNDILQRYPAIDRKFRRLLALKVQAAQALTGQLAARGVLTIDAGQLEHFCESIAMQLTFWFNYEQLRTRELPEALLIHEGVFHIMTGVSPYLAPEYRYIYEESRGLYKKLAQ